MTEKGFGKPQFERYDSQPELLLPDEAHAEKLRPGEQPPKRSQEKAQKSAVEVRKAVAEAEPSIERVDPFKRLEQAQDAPQLATPVEISRDLLKVTWNRESRTIQRQLPVLQRNLSKFIHQPAIRVASEAAGKTISRPSGLLGGGLVALLGTSGYLYTAKHAGFRYNYLVFLMLFAGGYAVGLILELVIWAATASRRKALD